MQGHGGPGPAGQPLTDLRAEVMDGELFHHVFVFSRSLETRTSIKTVAQCARVGRREATFTFGGSVTCVCRLFPRERRMNTLHLAGAAPVHYLTDRLV